MCMVGSLPASLTSLYLNVYDDPYQLSVTTPYHINCLLSFNTHYQQVIQGGAANQDGRLHVGMRILQVNSASMHGKTYDEALHVLQGVLDRINLLACFGYDPKSLPAEGEGELEESEEESTSR